jgi:multidrug efflux pump subunit AcrA (membrane-fusion protein)
MAMRFVESFKSVGSKVLWGLQIVLVRLRFIGLMAAVALLVASWDQILVRLERLARPAATPDTVGSADHEYYCPMDPSVIRAEPAKCPICGMPLSKRKKGAPETLPPGVIARVQLAPNRVNLAGVGLAMVVRRPLEQAIDTVGVMQVDERRLARISARVRGRVERLYVDFTGVEVAKDAALACLYSQDLFTSARELQLARAQGGPTLEAAKQRLRLWGLSEDQITVMTENGGEPQVHVTVPSPISGTVMTRHVVAGDYVMEGSPMYTIADLSVLWMVARVFEDEARLVHTGQRVEIRSSAYPERTFEGRVSFVEPTVDAATRTVGVRVDVPNAERLLRPGMYVRALLRTPIGPGGVVEPGRHAVLYRCCSACPDVETDTPGPCEHCGMPLTPVDRPGPVAPADAYVCRCPMHPGQEYRSTVAGPCALCGASLVPEDQAAPLATAAPAGPRETMTVYECPGHPEQTRDRPGNCDPCGTMDLIPRQVPLAEGQALVAKAAAERGEAPASTPGGAETMTVYECPGHPEQTRDRPGNCDPCGTMDLIPRQVSLAEGQALVAKAAAARGEGPATPTAPQSPPGPQAGGAVRTRTIYECPMHPEVTQDTPGECAPCGGMKLIPREVPVDDDQRLPLVVPVDAVIDTGARKIVYRQSSPGVYDAVEVQLGPRVGDFHPVIAGLRAGDQVVARGAFLVDAEARLSPGAAVNYFGASAGPSAAPQGGGK